MYFKYNNVSEVIELLTSYKIETEAKIEAWKQVEIKKKKNGEEYAKIGQATVNAKFGQYYPVEDAFHPYITVCFKCGYKYMTDNVQAFYYVDELSVAERVRDVVWKDGWSRATSPLNAEELRTKISEYIEKLEKHKISLEKQIDAAPTMFNKFREAIEKATKELTQSDLEIREKEIYPTSLFYAITSTN